MLITPQYPVSPGTMARNASTAEHPFALDGLVRAYVAGIAPSGHGLSPSKENASLVGSPAVSAQEWTLASASVQYLSVPPPVIGTGDFTLAVWMRSTGDGEDHAVKLGDTVLNQAVGIYRNGATSLRCGFHAGTEIILDTVITSGWRFVVLTGGGGNLISAYIDGQVVEEDTATTYDLASAYCYLGSSQLAYAAGLWDGGLDCLLIYDRRFSRSEQANLYDITRNDRTAWARRKPIHIPYAPAPAVGGGGIRNPRGGPMSLRNPLGRAS